MKRRTSLFPLLKTRDACFEGLFITIFSLVFSTSHVNLWCWKEVEAVNLQVWSRNRIWTSILELRDNIIIFRLSLIVEDLFAICKEDFCDFYDIINIEKIYINRSREDGNGSRGNRKRQDRKSGIRKIESHAAHKLQRVTNKTSDLLEIPRSPLSQRSLNLATSMPSTYVRAHGHDPIKAVRPARYYTNRDDPPLIRHNLLNPPQYSQDLGLLGCLKTFSNRVSLSRIPRISIDAGDTLSTVIPLKFQR